MLDNVAPYKKVRVTEAKPSWWSEEYGLANAEMLRLKRIAIRSGDQLDWIYYKRMRNRVGRLKRRLITDQLDEKLQASPSPKTAWRLFNEVAGRRKKAREAINHVVINNIAVSDKSRIANIFAEQFVKVPDECAGNEDVVLDCSDPQEGDPVIDNITVEEVIMAMKKIDKSKPFGFDTIPCRIFKEGSKVLAPILCNLFNRSVAESSFPELMKISVVYPLYKKKGSKSDPNNYRPIAIIPIIAKIFEIIVCSRLTNYLERKEFFTEAQHGFRRDHSCMSATVLMASDIANEIDKKNLVGTLFLDYQNAFGLANYTALIRKLKGAGLSSNSVEWFKSYLTNRKIIVQIEEGFHSDFFTCKAGVPAGSNLGPILWSILINDLPSYVQNNVESTVGLFADDGRITCWSPTEAGLQENMTAALQASAEWSRLNKAILSSM
jgi:hypothetical protein